MTNRNRSGDGATLTAVAAALAAGWWLVDGQANVPVVDDWVYAWSVEHLLRTGRLAVLDISAIYPVVQIVWGALFSYVGGFSFGMLRLSTLALAATGCWSVALTVRELGCERRTGLLAAFALLLHPVYFFLSYSFMTDVPFVSVSAVALYWYVRALRRGETRALWIGGGAAVAAFLIRPLAIVLPLSVLPAFEWGGLRDRERRRELALGLAAVGAALAAMVILQRELPGFFGPLNVAVQRETQLQWWGLVSFADYGRWTLGILLVASFPLAPLLVTYATTKARLAHAGLAAAVIGAAFWLAGVDLRALPDWQTWSLQEFTARSVMGGDLAPSSWSERAGPIVNGLGLIALGGLCVIAVEAWRRRVAAHRAWRIPVAAALLHAVAIHVLWLYNDRYYVVLAPMLAIGAAAALDRHPRGRVIAAAALLVWAVVDVTGTRDALAVNQTAAELTGALEASGVPPSDIDAGYALNGWRLYAHPANLPAGADRHEAVPFVTSKAITRYSIRTTPAADAATLRHVTLAASTWQASHDLYLVRRNGELAGR